MTSRPSNSISIRTVATRFREQARELAAGRASAEEASKALAGGDAIIKLAKLYRESTETVNAVQAGRLALQSRLGELMPPEKGGRGKAKPSHDVGRV